MRCMRNLTFAFREVSSSKVNEILALIKTFQFTRTLLYFDEDWKTLSKMIITLSDISLPPLKVWADQMIRVLNDLSITSHFQIIFNLYVLLGVICNGDLYFCNRMKNFRKAKIFLRLLSFLSIKPTTHNILWVFCNRTCRVKKNFNN